MLIPPSPPILWGGGCLTLSPFAWLSNPVWQVQLWSLSCDSQSASVSFSSPLRSSLPSRLPAPPSRSSGALNESLLWLGTSQEKCDYERDVSMSKEDFELLDAAVYRWVPLTGGRPVPPLVGAARAARRAALHLSPPLLTQG